MIVNRRRFIDNDDDGDDDDDDNKESFNDNNNLELCDRQWTNNVECNNRYNWRQLIILIIVDMIFSCLNVWGWVCVRITATTTITTTTTWCVNL